MTVAMWSSWGLSGVALVVGLVCVVQILAHAFKQSPGTGFMTLCIPLFVFVYAFAHFEHRRKGWIVAGFIGGIGLAVLLEAARGRGLTA